MELNYYVVPEESERERESFMLTPCCARGYPC
jgi:hypothetical protein